MSRRTWLEESIIWEPVDGQYVVATCEHVELECRTKLMDENEYQSIFAQR